MQTALSSVRHIKPPVAPGALAHRELRQGEFWRAIPAYAEVDERTFLDHIWQGQRSVKSADELFATVRDLVDPRFLEDAREGFRRAPMAVRVSPYMIASVDWERSVPTIRSARNSFRWARSCKAGSSAPDPWIRCTNSKTRPFPGLTHRYVDKALFLAAQRTCPVYCRFCTRSYAIGRRYRRSSKKSPLAKTPQVSGKTRSPISHRVPELEDIVDLRRRLVSAIAPKNAPRDRRCVARDPARCAACASRPKARP